MFKKLFEKITGIDRLNSIIETQRTIINRRAEDYNTLFKYNSFLLRLNREKETLEKNLERARTQTLETDAELRKTEKKYESIINEYESRIKTMQQVIQGQKYTGKFYVFNPDKDKPRKIYLNYQSALNDAKSVSKISDGEKVYVLKLLTAVECKETVEKKQVIQMSKENKVLDLVLKSCWFDKIASGQKNIEYREVKKSWASRIYENGKQAVELALLSKGYARKEQMLFKIDKIEVLSSGINTDLKVKCPVYAIHLGEQLNIVEWYKKQEGMRK